MGNEQEAPVACFSEPPIVECRHPRLAGPCGGDDQVSVVPVTSFSCKLFEHLVLVRLWVEVEIEGHQPLGRVEGFDTPLLGQRIS